MSQKKSEKKTIGDHEYEVFMLSPKVARRMLVKIGKVIGPTLGALAGEEGINDKTLDKKLDSKTLSRAFETLAEHLNEDDLDVFFDQLSAVSTVDGVKLKEQFEHHFRGRIGEQFRWFAFALQVNFADFFGAWGDVSLPPTVLEAVKG